MSNTISREKVEKFLTKGGDINLLIGAEEQKELRRMLFANKTNWTKIADLPTYVYHEFNMKMRSECIVADTKIPYPNESGPHIMFEERSGRINIRIDDDPVPKGIFHYRKCLSVVAYFTGIKGGIIHPITEKGRITFSDEDWILISIAARYCLMPPKLVQKVLLLTQMYSDEGSLDRDKSFLASFIDNLAFQTDLPDWVVSTRLHEMAYSEKGNESIFEKKPIDEIIDFYRKNEKYTDPIV